MNTEYYKKQKKFQIVVTFIFGKIGIYLLLVFSEKWIYVLKKVATMESTPLQRETTSVTWTMQAVTEAHYVNSTIVHVQNTISRALKKLAIQLTLWSVSTVLTSQRILLQNTPKETDTPYQSFLISKSSQKNDSFVFRYFLLSYTYYIHLCRQLLFNSLFFNILRNYLQLFRTGHCWKYIFK